MAETHSKISHKLLKKRLVRILDCAISLFVIAPVVVFYWRGTWYAMDNFLFPENQVATAWVSYIGSITILLTLSFSQNVLQKAMRKTKKKHFAVYSVILRMYIYIYGFACVAHWRGLWYVLNHYTGVTTLSNIYTVAIGTGTLMFVRSLRNFLAPPLFVGLDFGPDLFSVSTRFHTKSSDLEHYILDTVFTTCVVHGMVVFIWRGVWELMTIYVLPLIPEDLGVSPGVGTLSLGYGICILAMLGQNPVDRIATELIDYHKFYKVLFEDMYIFLANVGSIALWHGVWTLTDAYFLPDDKQLSAWLSHVIGYVSLTCLLASNSVVVAGCFLDGDLLNGHNMVVFDIAYVKELTKLFWPLCCKRKEKQVVLSKYLAQSTNIILGPVTDSIKAEVPEEPPEEPIPDVRHTRRTQTHSEEFGPAEPALTIHPLGMFIHKEID